MPDSRAPDTPASSLRDTALLRALRRLVTLLRERFPLTVQGLATLGIALLALRVFGYGRMDLVVFALAICALAIVCFSTVIVLLPPGAAAFAPQLQAESPVQLGQALATLR